MIDLGIAPEGLGAYLHEPGSRLRVSARKQGHLMTEPYEFLGEIGDDTFAAAVKQGRHTFIQWRNLGDSHKGWFTMSDESIVRFRLTPFGSLLGAAEDLAALSGNS